MGSICGYGLNPSRFGKSAIDALSLLPIVTAADWELVVLVAGSSSY